MKSSILIILFVLPFLSLSQIRLEGKPVSLDSINSPEGQNFLVLDPVRKKMAFTQERGGSGNLQIMSREVALDSVVWDVTFLPDFLGEKGMLSPLGFMEDGLVINRVDFEKGIYQGSIVKVLADEATEEISIPFFKNKSPIQSGCISANGRYMILSIESNNTYGVEDLYLARRKPNGSWSSLRNLGFQLNTEFQEITPFLAPDNRTLFFASNRDGGQGSFDIYYSIREDDSWRKWSKPVNLGAQVNTSGSETSFTFQDGGQWAYFISSQDSDGYGDVMKIAIQEEIDQDEEEEFLSLDEVIDKEIMIKILDRQTRELISSELIFDTLEVMVPGGVFILDSTYLAYADVELKSDGYLPTIFPLGKDLIVGVNEIVMDRVEAGKTFTLSNVLFHRGTASLIDGTEKEIDLVVEMMNDNPDIKILLKGHTDNQGDPVLNVQLSEDRVKAVKEYIVSKGISPYRIRGRGYGGNQPIASNEDENTRKLNRRVEFEVIEN